jgi:hypothetical protein
LQAATASGGKHTITATAFGNWTNTGVRTEGDYETGIIDGVQHMGYYVFDLASVAGATVSSVELVLDAPEGVTTDITSPKSGLRTAIRPSVASVATLTTGKNDAAVYADVRAESSQQDFTYSYLQNTAKAETITFGLLTYDSDRIPDDIKNATATSQLALTSFPTNFGAGAVVGSNGTGNNVAFAGSGAVVPTLVVTVE